MKIATKSPQLNYSFYAEILEELSKDWDTNNLSENVTKFMLSNKYALQCCTNIFAEAHSARILGKSVGITFNRIIPNSILWFNKCEPKYLLEIAAKSVTKVSIQTVKPGVSMDFVNLMLGKNSNIKEIDVDDDDNSNALILKIIPQLFAASNQTSLSLTADMYYFSKMTKKLKNSVILVDDIQEDLTNVFKQKRYATKKMVLYPVNPVSLPIDKLPFLFSDMLKNKMTYPDLKYLEFPIQMRGYCEESNLEPLFSSINSIFPSLKKFTLEITAEIPFHCYNTIDQLIKSFSQLLKFKEWNFITVMKFRVRTELVPRIFTYDTVTSMIRKTSLFFDIGVDAKHNEIYAILTQKLGSMNFLQLEFVFSEADLS